MSSSSRTEMKEKLAASAANLFPGYFALVMATGIVSIASFLLGYTVIARVLLIVNIAAYILLWALLIARLLFFRQQFAADFSNHAKSPGFFTVVAGTCVLGSQLVIVSGQARTAAGLWVIGALLWLIITYAFFTTLITRPEKPPLEGGLNGGWLVIIVATQSVAILSVLISGLAGEAMPALLFFALCLYLAGGMLYIMVITLIFYRLVFLPLTEQALTPPYWIAMGAVAITTLAGATLILNAEKFSLLGEILPFLKGFTLFFWAIATWWIPLLLLLGAWRHLMKRLPLAYDPQYWSMVFPLGMYTTCTIRLSQALGLEFLMAIPQGFIFIAWAAWLAVFSGLAVHLVKAMRPSAEG